MTAAPVILVAEDNEQHQYIVQAALKLAGVAATVRFVSDGEELIEYLRRTGRYEMPSNAPTPGLLLLDLNLPGVDGLAALRIIREDARLRQLPIVILSTADAASTIDLAYRLGANSYLVKVMDFDAFVAQMRHFGTYWLETARLPSSVH
jgi:CheY-like chemotaxis protein